MKKIIVISAIILSVTNFNFYAQTPTSGTNAIMEQTPREAMTTLSGSTYKTVQTNIQYFDKLGRPSQVVLYRGSPDAQKDILSSTTQYDLFGRANIAILPTPSDVQTGAYKSSPLSLATSFYDNDANPFTETIFEASPANRPLKGFGAGQNWRTANKFVKTDYSIADAGDVPLWNVSSTGATKVSGGYGLGQLLKTTTTSEQGNKVVQYKDKDGNIIRKDVEYQTGLYMRTLYIYDDFLRLRFVVQPNAYETLLNQSSFTESSTVYLEGIFGYKYDNLGRVTESHIAGAGTKRFVYDKNDRIVLENDDRDANIPLPDRNYYRFTKYDIFGRVIQTGLIFGIGGFSRSQLQMDFDNHPNLTYEERGTDLQGYTNRSFPSDYTPIESSLRTVTYYDNYDNWQTDVNYNFKSAQAFHAQASAKGMVTGKLVRNLKTNTWQRMIMYYDYRGKNIQDYHFTNRNNIIRKDYQYRFNGELLKTRIVKTNNSNVVLSTKIFTYEYDNSGRKVAFVHNGKPIVSYSYDEIGRLNLKKFSPSGKTQGSKQTGNWTDANNWLSGILPTMADDVTINTGQTLTIPAGEKAFAGKLNDNGILQNFGTLDMGKITTSDLYLLSYQYHIRGSLKGINTDASGNLTSSLFSYRLDFESGTNGYFDGNISKQSWKSNIDNKERSYTHTYDGSSRLKSSTYSSTQAGEDYALSNVNYDFNGNITNLSRNGATNTNYTAFGNVDNLTYTYQSNSNKLLKIQDGTTTNTDLGDFRDGANTDDDYDYWLDGSLKRDRNKKIASITYNYLKLPEVITFDDNKTITTEYNAEGTKLKKVVSGGETTDYEEDEIYVNGVLYQTAHDEGRINSQGQYEYNITDHLGNLRVAFRDSLGIAVPTQSIFYEPWGLSMKGMQTTRNTLNFNKFQYNGKEIDLSSGYIDFGARMYGAAEGRWFTIDPSAERTYNVSPNTYNMNNAINMIDRDGKYAVSVHYDITYQALINLGYSHKKADLIAHYSSTYADHPNKGPLATDLLGHGIGIEKNRRLMYRSGIDYSKTNESQDEKNSHFHSMMSNDEAKGGKTRAEAKARGLSFGWKNIFAQANGVDLGKLGQGLHALQDAIAHQGVATDDHLFGERFINNLNSVKLLANDMYGNTQEASTLTKSALIVMDLIRGNRVNLREGDTLDFQGMSSQQLSQVMKLLIQQGFNGTIKIK